MNNLKEQAYENKKKSKLAAYLWLIFLGHIGIHRFYLRRYITAIIILTCTLGSFGFEPLFVVSLVFMVIDLFLIPKMVRTVNVDIALSLGLDELNESQKIQRENNASTHNAASPSGNEIIDDTIEHDDQLSKEMKELENIIKWADEYNISETEIPRNREKLKNKTRLSLSNTGIDCLPLSIGVLNKLTEIWVDHNKLHKLPDSMQNLTELRLLQLESNEIIEVNNCLSGLDKLESLYLRNNSLDYIPESVCDLKRLKNLYIEGNKISELPEFISKIQGLRSLTIGGKYLKSIPLWVFSFFDLEHLSISDTENINTLPDAFGGLWHGLKFLQICDNEALEYIPESIGKLERLVTLEITGNKQLNELPDNVEGFPNLVKCSLYSNNLSHIPEWICECNNLKELWLFGNNLTTLPDAIGRLHKLKKLKISSNKFENLPDSIDGLSLDSDNMEEIKRIISGIEYDQKILAIKNRIKSLFGFAYS